MTDIIENLQQTLKDSNIVGLSPSSTFKPIDEVDNAGYRFESERLKSFCNWPVSYVKPEKLAEAGFYYLGEGDRVKCFECNIEICQWAENDDPMEDHERWSNRCRFIKKQPCGNIPLGADPNTIPQLRGSIDVCGIYHHNADNDILTKELQLLSTAKLHAMGLGRMKGPTHPDYASYDARLESFDSWPRAMPHSKELLAQAGYYYTGNGDQTLCYHCGGGLKDWESGDDPWEEHAKWFPQCTYLLMVKGKEYVNKVTGQLMSPISPEETLHMNLPSFVKTIEPLSSSLERSQSIQAENAPGPSKAVEMKGSSTSAEVKECKDLNISEAHCNKSDDARLCKICYNEELGVVFLPCGHMVACVDCAPEMTICAVCRNHVAMKVRAFLS
ncbi:PREDICTED: baculoviral IAP repeat-containing protein 7-B-like [Polistes canadensis]|uniref:baculoviral IAP repeat-containing protein 7-B-like n=1 Tax=Polistes canadensis TaxID=91411 RepID=UPI000718E5EB|nr:PREDICTED: baculoviral IAP repeat-containing protein 7-B-like [Polistes canadensis]XP_014613192.1 PREDICTED: baculoviral IAP repeat-containing protein 7-B-like [Polistes canadensis]